MASERGHCQGKRARGRHGEEGGIPPLLFLSSKYTDVKRPIKVGARLLPVITTEYGVWGGELTSKGPFLPIDF